MSLRTLSLSLLVLQSLGFASARQEVAKAFDAFMDDAKMKQASVSFCILPEDGKEPIFERNSHLSLYPASILKLITTGAALEVLGPNYRFMTKLEYSGTLDKNEGMLTGDLFIKGDGDPTLGSERFGFGMGDLFLRWRIAVEEAKIRSIRGRIVGDTSCFESQMGACSWLSEDTGNYYAAGPSGLCIRENRYDIYFEPGAKEGDTVKIISTFPSLPSLSFVNDLKTGKEGSGDGVTIFGMDYHPSHHLIGTVPAGVARFKVSGAIYDPPLVAAETLQATLSNAGVFISCKPRSSTSYHLPSSSLRTVIDVVESPPLKEIIKHTNKLSINIYAEQLLKKMGQKMSGIGSYLLGHKVQKEYLHSLGIDLDGSKFVDGCGLSRKNLATAHQFATFLSLIKTQDYFIHFYSSLPVAGAQGLEGGTLASFGEGTVLSKALRAKTGSAEGTYCLAGYLKTSFGGETPFALIINNSLLSRAKMAQRAEAFLEKLALIEESNF